jgi:hypothetical protein
LTQSSTRSKMGSQCRLCWLWLLVFALVSLVTVSQVFGAPAALDCRNIGFTSPAAGATVSGQVEIRGRALLLDFQFYKVEYSPVGSDEWLLIGTDVTKKPVENGRLTLWQTRLVPNGTYRLRLRAVDPTGNYCEAVLAPVKVDNTSVQATDIPPPPTETPMLTVVPPQPTPTAKLNVAVEIQPVQGTPGSLPTRSPTISLPEFNITGLVLFFLFGVLGMFIVLVFVGVVLFARRLG